MRQMKVLHCKRSHAVALEDSTFLVYRNAGHPYNITFVTSYPAHLAPGSQQLCNRIAQLQQAFPLLQSHIRDGRTLEPYYEQREFAWDPKEIYREKEMVNGGIEAIMKQEWESIDDSTGPEWKVTRYGGETVHFALTISHLYTDGHGALRLNLLLFNQEPLVPELMVIPSIVERFDNKPRLMLILSVVFRLMIAPLLPLFIRRWVLPTNLWNGPYDGGARLPPIECPDGLQITRIPIDIFRDASLSAKQHQVPTAHSLLYMAYLAAIWSVYTQEQAAMSFFAQMPTSERERHSDFGYCTGNYYGAAMMYVTINSEADFFAACRQMHNAYSSEKGKDDSQRIVGIRGLLKPKLNDTTSEKYRQERPTNQEDSVLDIAEGSRPFRFSNSFSNLTRSTLPTGATGMCWSLASSPLQPPLTMDVVGHERGVELVTTWKDGAAMDAEGVEKVCKQFERIMSRLAETKRAEAVSFRDLAFGHPGPKKIE